MSIDVFRHPRSVAVMGATDRPTTTGGAVLKNLLIAGFSGEVFAVADQAAEGSSTMGCTTYPSLAALPRPADLVVIALGPERVLAAVREAARTGHRALLILTERVGETGGEDAARQELATLLAKHRITAHGPCSVGLVDLLHADTPFAASIMRDLPMATPPHERGGRVAFLSTSNAVAEDVVAKSHALSIPVGAVIAVGESPNLGMAEYLEALGDDAACAAIAVCASADAALERWMPAAHRAAQRKPLAVLLPGTSGPAADAGSAVQALCAPPGVVAVRSLHTLLLAAKGFARFPRGLGERMLLVSNATGPALLCADRCREWNLALPPLPPALVDTLQRALPEGAKVRNPLGLLTDARRERFGAALGAVLRHAAAFDAIGMIHAIPFDVDPGPVIEAIARLARATDVPILHTMLGSLAHRSVWFSELESAGVLAFNDMDDMAACAGLLHRYRAACAAATPAARTRAMAPP